MVQSLLVVYTCMHVYRRICTNLNAISIHVQWLCLLQPIPHLHTMSSLCKKIILGPSFVPIHFDKV